MPSFPSFVPVCPSPEGLKADYCPPVFHHSTDNIVIPAVGSSIVVGVKTPDAFPAGMTVYMTDGTNGALLGITGSSLSNCSVTLLNIGSEYTADPGTVLTGGVSMVLFGPNILQSVCSITTTLGCDEDTDIAILQSVSSAQMDADEYALSKKFINDFADTLTFMSPQAELHWQFTPMGDVGETAVDSTVQADANVLKAAVEAFTPSGTGNQMEVALNLSNADLQAGRMAKKVIVIITAEPGYAEDGASPFLPPELGGGGGDPETEAVSVKGDGVRIVIVNVGVAGDGVNYTTDEVNTHFANIGSWPSSLNIVKVNSFENLSDVINEVILAVCP